MTIGMERVTVEIRVPQNTTGQDITTEVLFCPLPAERLSFSPRPLPILGWHVWAEGKELSYETEAQATNPNGVDQTDLLRRLSIDIASYGHFDQQLLGEPRRRGQAVHGTTRGIDACGSAQLGNFPTWTVFKTYHWRQTFPAHKILHVRHEYAPASGAAVPECESISRRAHQSDSCVGPGCESS